MWYGIIGVIALVLSFLYFFRPETVKKIDQVGSKSVSGSEKLFQWKKTGGSFLSHRGDSTDLHRGLRN